MDFPNPPVTPLFLHTWSRWSAGWAVRGYGGTLAVASLTWPVANTAFYIPMWVPFPYLVKRVFWLNGSSVTSTNMDFGIYTINGTKIYSTGSTAASGVSVIQYVTPGTDFILAPGRYYFALADSSTTANRGGQGSTGAAVLRLRMAGVLQEASALPLPATMTGASVANSCYPYCGVTRMTTGFA